MKPMYSSGDAVEEEADAIEVAKPEAAQECRPPVGELHQVAVGEVAELALVVLVDEGQLVAAPGLPTCRSTHTLAMLIDAPSV